MLEAYLVQLPSFLTSFSDVEKNLTITFIWLFLKRLYDYSTKLSFVGSEEEEPESSFLVFLFSLLILYLISSVGIIGITLTYDFWTGFYQLKLGDFWWLPSVISIGLWEIASFLPVSEIEAVSPLYQETIFKKTRKISLYLLFVFLILALTWGILLFRNWEDLPGIFDFLIDVV